MATKAHAGQWLARGVHQCQWSGLANGDVGDTLNAPMLGDKSVQIEGTAGTGFGVKIEGSNDGTNFETLTNPGGTSLTYTATGKSDQILQNMKFIRPSVTGGDGTTSVTVTIISRGGKI